jgi:predicted RNA-binding Zn-ribbon protein involved in translation (DUF1610 family)
MTKYYCENCGEELTYKQDYCGGKRDYEVCCHNCGVFFGPEALEIEPGYNNKEED